MRLAKTEAGQRVLRDRSVPLTARQRAAFILCDAKHSREHVLASTRAVGVTEDDIRQLIELGLVAEVPDAAEVQAQAAAEAFHSRTPQQRYGDAYPIATKLTAGLGLRGFRLNLAVERASDHAQLAEIAPRIRDAVGEEAYRPLHAALFG
jgi:hypothetical protein